VRLEVVVVYRVRLLDEVPVRWRPLFELLAATGLRISEAIGMGRGTRVS
jgi:site-specific recombinase XerD